MNLFHDRKQGDDEDCWARSLDNSVIDEFNPDYNITASNHQLSNHEAERPAEDQANLLI